MVAEQYFAKLLRFLIDTDGDTPSEIATQISAGNTSILWLQDFEVKRNKFHESAFSTLYDLAKDYFDKYGVLITDDLLADEIRLSELTPAVKTELFAALAQVREYEYRANEYPGVRAFIMRNYAENMFVNSMKSGADRIKESGDPIGGMDYVMRAFASAKASLSPSTNKIDQTLNLHQYAEIMLDEFENGREHLRICGSYGFPSFDLKTGGLKRGEFTVLGGKKSSGKSYIVQHIGLHNALHAKQKRNVVLATRENSTRQNWDRAIAAISGISIQKVSARILTPNEREIMVAAMRMLKSQELQDGNRIIIVPPNLCETPEMLKSQIQLSMGSENPDIVIADHLGVMKASNRRISAAWEIRETVTQELKDMTVFFDCHTWSPCHLNRAGNAKAETDLTDIQFDSVGQIVDTLFIANTNPSQPYIPPNPPETWEGLPGQVRMKVERGRTVPIGMEIFVEVEFSRGIVKECLPFAAKPDPVNRLQKKQNKDKRTSNTD